MQELLTFQKEKIIEVCKSASSYLVIQKILSMIKNDEFKKGNVINVARIAGIMGVKQTSNFDTFMSQHYPR